MVGPLQESRKVEGEGEYHQGQTGKEGPGNPRGEALRLQEEEEEEEKRASAKEAEKKKMQPLKRVALPLEYPPKK